MKSIALLALLALSCNQSRDSYFRCSYSIVVTSNVTGNISFADTIEASSYKFRKPSKYRFYKSPDDEKWDAAFYEIEYGNNYSVDIERIKNTCIEFDYQNIITN